MNDCSAAIAVIAPAPVKWRYRPTADIQPRPQEQSLSGAFDPKRTYKSRLSCSANS